MGRAYDFGDKKYPSCTTILGIMDKSSALMPWAANQTAEYIRQNATPHPDGAVVTEELLKLAPKKYREVSKEAMDIGSEIHNLIEVYIKDGKDAVGEMRPEVENGFLAFLEWESENIKEWVQSELTVVDHDSCVAGTLDAVAILKDVRTVVIDFKSSKGFYDGYAEQIACYRNCYEKMMDLQVDGQGILRLDKVTGLPEYKDYSKSHKRDLATFNAILEVYYLQKDRRLKNNPKVKQIKEQYA